MVERLALPYYSDTARKEFVRSDYEWRGLTWWERVKIRWREWRKPDGARSPFIDHGGSWGGPGWGGDVDMAVKAGMRRPYEPPPRPHGRKRLPSMSEKAAIAYGYRCG